MTDFCFPERLRSYYNEEGREISKPPMEVEYDSKLECNDTPVMGRTDEDWRKLGEEFRVSFSPGDPFFSQKGVVRLEPDLLSSVDMYAWMEENRELVEAIWAANIKEGLITPKRMKPDPIDLTGDAGLDQRHP
jgi:hypothetical protein